MMTVTPCTKGNLMRCGAKNKQNGGACQNAPVIGRTRCRMHGGKSLVGSACPHYRTGRYSAYVPERLRERYQQAETDQELLSLRGEVALVDARLADLLSRVDTGESGALWAELRRAYRAFTKARQAGDDQTTALARVEHLIERAGQDHQAWAEIGTLIEQRRKLAESESKRMATLQQMLTTEQALSMVRAIVDIVTRHVPDRQALSAIIVDLQRIAGPGHGLPADAEEAEG
jgi:hypothetical protein